MGGSVAQQFDVDVQWLVLWSTRPVGSLNEKSCGWHRIVTAAEGSVKLPNWAEGPLSFQLLRSG